MSDPIEDAIRQVHATREHRDRLQDEVDRLNRALELQRAETDRLSVSLTQVSAERDMYQCRCAVLGNEMTLIKNMVIDAERKARADSLGRPELTPLDDETALAQISYAPRRN